MAKELKASLENSQPGFLRRQRTADLLDRLAPDWACTPVRQVTPRGRCRPEQAARNARYQFPTRWDGSAQDRKRRERAGVARYRPALNIAHQRQELESVTAAADCEHELAHPTHMPRQADSGAGHVASCGPVNHMNDTGS